MKKIIGFLSVISLFTVMACGNEKPKEVTKEVIVVPAQQTKDAEKNTVITLDKKGVKVSTKKVEVVINPDKKNN